ncbi:hypothetical protein, partial [Rhabdothermincola sp.]|uniref:hypothetical protein n=1 Tax=Rhabdothermincola sp. TaxID=2820405 RepID=UPI002FE0F9B1
MATHHGNQHARRLLLGAGPSAEIDAVIAAWEREPLTDATRRRLGELARRFAARLDATGVASITDATREDCEGFVWAPTRRRTPPSLHTVHLRRTALRAIYRTVTTLAPGTVDPSAGVDLPAKTGRRPRPLTDDELDRLRIAALGRTQQPLRAAAVIALAEASATSGEIPCIRWADVDLTASTVALPGADPIKARTGVLTDWGTAVLGRWQRACLPEPDHPVVTRRPSAATGHSAQAATANQLTRLLRSAGLDHRDIRPGSVRLWAAATALRRGGIEAAARTLGIDSLDAAADALDHRWQAHQ